MGVVSSCCEGGQQPFTYRLFKDAIESSPRRRVKDCKPEVWVAIRQLDLKVDLSGVFPLNSFSLKDCRCIVTMSIQGTNLHIVQELGSEVALKLMDKVGVLGNTRRGGSEFLGKLPPGRSLLDHDDHHSERVGAGKGGWEKGDEAKSFEVVHLVSLTKQSTDDEVHVTVKDMETTMTNGTNLTLSVETLRRHVEKAISEQAMAVIAEQLGEAKDKRFGR